MTYFSSRENRRDRSKARNEEFVVFFHAVSAQRQIHFRRLMTSSPAQTRTDGGSKRTATTTGNHDMSPAAVAAAAPRNKDRECAVGSFDTDEQTDHVLREFIRRGAGSVMAPWRRALRFKLFGSTHARMCQLEGQPLSDESPKHDVGELVIFVILGLNMILAALYDPLHPGSPRQLVVKWFDLVFSTMFVAECIVRVVCFGPYCFYRDAFHLLDAGVVLTSFIMATLELAGVSVGSFTIVRTVRAFRALRTLTVFPAAQKLARSIVTAVRSLSDVCVLYAIFMMTLSVIGVTQFKGAMQTRCVNNDLWTLQPMTTTTRTATETTATATFTTTSPTVTSSATTTSLTDANNVTFTPTTTGSVTTSVTRTPTVTSTVTSSTSISRTNATARSVAPIATPRVNISLLPGNVEFTLRDFVCGGKYDTAVNLSNMACHPEQLCDSVTADRLLTGYVCPYGYSCVDVQNPFYGAISFDSVPQALIVLFICVTQESWSKFAYMLMDSFDDTAAFYFIAIIFLGSLFIVNLSIVIVTVSFEQSSAFQENKASRLVDLKRQRGRSNTLTSNTTLGALPPARLRSGSRTTVATERSTMAGGSDPLSNASIVGAAAAAASSSADIVAAITSGNRSGAGADASDWDRRINAIPVLKKLRKWIKRGFEKKYFSLVTTVIIVTNITFQSVQFYGMPPAMSSVIDASNVVFTALYFLELMLRLLYFGPKRFFRRPLNIFDTVILVLSIIDIGLGPSFPSMQSLRCVHLLKALKFMPDVLRWAVVVVGSLKASLLLMFFIFIVVFVFAVFGMQMFGGRFCGFYDSDVDSRPDNSELFLCPNRPRAHFDDIVTALITSFIVLATDGWNEVLYNGIRARGPVATIFFIVYFIISNYILLNLFIGILLSGPSPEEVDNLGKSIFDDGADEMAEAMNQNAAERKNLKLIRDAAEEANERRRAEAPNAELEFRTRMGIDPLADDNYVVHMQNIAELQVASAPGFRRRRGRGMSHSIVLFSTESMNLGAFKSQLRSMLESPSVEYCLAFLIIATSVCMALENPIAAPDTPRATVLRAVDVALTGIFILEVFAHVYAFGLYKDEESFLKRDLWNVVDAFLVIISLVAVIAYGFGLSAWVRRALAFRAIRPLRIVKWSPGLRVVFYAFARSVIPLRNILVLAFIITLLWGLLGVQLFNGKFYRCSDPTYTIIANCTAAGQLWMNAPLHFDNMPNAFLTLLSIASRDTWAASMWNGIDAVGQGIAPIVNTSHAASWYFVSFVVVGSMFLLNLIVSVIIDTYNSEKARLGIDLCFFLTPQQNAYVRTHRRLLRGIPQVFYDDEDATRLQRYARKLTFSPIYQWFVTGLILFNSVVCCLNYYGAPPALEVAILLCNTVISILFVFEVCVKMVALGWQRFSMSRFNLFDGAITLMCSVGVLCEVAMPEKGYTFIFRALRILTLFRLVRNAQRLREVIGRFSYSFYALLNVAALLGLSIFVFAVAGMKAFGTVRRQGAVTHQANFEDILRAMMLLFQMCTGGDWPDIMSALSVRSPACNEDIGECGVPWAAVVFCVLCTIVVGFVQLNLFIAVLLDTYVSSSFQMPISKDHVQEFFDVWFAFDAEQKMRIESTALLPLLRRLSPSNPLGYGYYLPSRQLSIEFRFVLRLRLREINGTVELQDLISALCRHAFGAPLPDSEIRRMQRYADKKFRTKEREKHRGKIWATYNTAERVAVLVLQTRWLMRKGRTCRPKSSFSIVNAPSGAFAIEEQGDEGPDGHQSKSTSRSAPRGQFPSTSDRKPSQGATSGSSGGASGSNLIDVEMRSTNMGADTDDMAADRSDFGFSQVETDGWDVVDVQRAKKCKPSDVNERGMSIMESSTSIGGAMPPHPVVDRAFVEAVSREEAARRRGDELVRRANDFLAREHKADFDVVVGRLQGPEFLRDESVSLLGRRLVDDDLRRRERDVFAEVQRSAYHDARAPLVAANPAISSTVGRREVRGALALSRPAAAAPPSTMLRRLDAVEAAAAADSDRVARSDREAGQRLFQSWLFPGAPVADTTQSLIVPSPQPGLIHRAGPQRSRYDDDSAPRLVPLEVNDSLPIFSVAAAAVPAGWRTAGTELANGPSGPKAATSPVAVPRREGVSGTFRSSVDL